MCENAARAETTESNERGRRRVASVVARMIEGGREATDRVRRKGRQMGSGKRQREGEGGREGGRFMPSANARGYFHLFTSVEDTKSMAHSLVI